MKNKNIFIILGVMLVLFLTVGAVFTMLAVPSTPNTPDLPDDPSDDVIDSNGAYNVSLMLLGATNSGNEYTIAKNEKLTITITADENYFLPSNVTVTGADHSWTVSENLKTAILELSNPTGDVNVTVTAFDTVQVKYTVINNTSSEVVTCDVTECPTSFSGSGTGNLVIFTSDCKIDSVTADPELTISHMGTDGGSDTYMIEWNAAAYPVDGILDITITLVDDLDNVMFNLSNCTVTDVQKS